jgi:hypothetical protein
MFSDLATMCMLPERLGVVSSCFIKMTFIQLQQNDVIVIILECAADLLVDELTGQDKGVLWRRGYLFQIKKRLPPAGAPYFAREDQTSRRTSE